MKTFFVEMFVFLQQKTVFLNVKILSAYFHADTSLFKLHRKKCCIM